ncbi:Bifunctional phosphonoacetaldehyde hydrolase/aminoethylphosphonate transaminase [Tritrichomonas foetus]|uniref:2-aminoethylphosphonate--pyruvate transaminase n=1 Tax=Tritrichomonas foetus TaxID=1144522 RepID=A0A1J4KHR5_9EUKA|nr:Bifunctional phosphonoacetaldehyde hydrolase/aminoethylphosphonate transaminase [Tritrichomonas foetus]|eukprot:OHT10929.1 Bifunctional phosphonoacetaldehyde hydrolase/aminoethylphosphonate transaminase [Tritrichomonas foetus]
MMNQIIERVAAQGYSPDSCVCADEVPKGRPFPYMVWRNLTNLGIPNTREVVKVGDTVSDIKEGTESNCWSVGVIMGSSELGLTEEEVAAISPEKLEVEKARVRAIYYEAGADYVIEKMGELPAVIADIERRLKQNEPHLLLTPGPLTTKASVKNAMFADHCTWEITTQVMNDITQISANNDYVTVLLQGSGSYAVEAMIQSFTNDDEETLFVTNGEYGKRIVQQAKDAGKKFSVLEFDMCTAVDPAAVEKRLDENPNIKAVFFVHSETTTGLINPINEIAPIVKSRGKALFVDAMSSFAAYEIDMPKLGIDAIAASANKCLEGLPGLAFIIAKRSVVEASKGRSKSHCLDVYDQYLGLYPGGGKFRFTSPTNILLALQQAILEYKHEGGLTVRRARYQENHRRLVEGMSKLGIKPIINPEWQSYIITTFDLGSINFSKMYNMLKENGYVIYPSKLTNHPTFRIGTIGNIYPQQIDRLCELIGEYLKANK